MNPAIAREQVAERLKLKREGEKVSQMIAMTRIVREIRDIIHGKGDHESVDLISVDGVSVTRGSVVLLKITGYELDQATLELIQKTMDHKFEGTGVRAIVVSDCVEVTVVDPDQQENDGK